MKAMTRVAATATAVLSISVLAMPLASAAEAAPAGRYDGKIRVCVQGLRGGEADVRVGGYSREIDSGDCRTFRGLRINRTYRVSADADRGCRLYEDTKWATARRDARTVVFYGRCFNRGDNDGGWNNGGWNNGDGPGRGDGNGPRGPRGPRN